jgi:hypothetical protein
MDARRSAPAPDSDPERGGGEEPPAILGSWRALYAAVIGELLLVIALCYWLTGWHR